MIVLVYGFCFYFVFLFGLALVRWPLGHDLYD